MSYIYVEHAIIEQESLSIVIIKEDGRIPVPVASLTVLFLGPGTRITHAAVKAICDNGCMAIWCGEGAGRFYAYGMGETRSSANLLSQAKLCMDEEMHMKVVVRMYKRRFPDLPDREFTLKQIRGMEGIRVKQAYKQASQVSGVQWNGREYKQTKWDASNEINRALSAANACLYGLCHAAIVALGYSPGLGFVHTGKMLSFVYDIADLYKAETTIPASFEVVSKKPDDVEREVRAVCRRYFKNHNVLKRIPEDIDWIFDISNNDQDVNSMAPGDIWDDEKTTSGGRNYSHELE
jgi:CRISPR-associated protein Cas1